MVALYLASRVVRAAGWAPPPGLGPALLLLWLLFYVAVIYLLIRSRRWIASHVLWRLRNRLIFAYLFIAVVPVALLAALGGVIGYYAGVEVAAHLLSDDVHSLMQQVSAVSRLALTLEQAGSPQLPPLNTVRSRLPGLTVDVGPAPQNSGAGAGSSDARLVTSGNRIWIESVAQAELAPGRAIQARARLPVSPQLLDSIAPVLGPLSLVWKLEGSPAGPAAPAGGAAVLRSAPAASVTSSRRALPPKQGWYDFPVSGATTLEAVRVDAAGRQVPSQVLAEFLVRPSGLEKRLQSSLGEFGAFFAILLSVIVVLFLVIELLALVAGIVLTRTITNTVDQLYQATQHVKARDFSHRIPIERRDQLGALGESFNSMTASIEALLEEQRQRQRLDNELAIAREVQTELFPRSLPSIPGLQLAAVCRAARVVSGDYYDCLQLDAHRVAVAVADVSGKGISAALVMASLNAALRSLVMSDGLGDGDTAVLAERLNRHLLLNTSDDRYATFFFAVYDSDSRILRYTNAGHLPPFFIAGGRVERLDRGGPVIGLLDNCSYEQASLKVEPGSLLVAYSDGMTEPENAYGEEFGMDRLIGEVLRHRQLPPQRLCDELIGAVAAWCAPAEPFDDQTILAARMG
ncbi:MAG TPA: PP2C family protein-serine/threonine phosphatase [Candidatus Acidoferrales bacterium]|nr:PP2C family protein-serine/threonine phosphatase [Candidatus Acidoferrales bacterium]